MFSPWVRVVMLATQRWRTLRKRDGAPYNADPKRSINASLTKTPAYGQVFERDPHIEGFWRLTPGTPPLHPLIAPLPASPRCHVVVN